MLLDTFCWAGLWVNAEPATRHEEKRMKLGLLHKVSSMFGYTAILFLTAAALFAQSNQGRITGTISDPAGAVVPSAQIEIKNSETGGVYRGGTSETGNYVIPVPSGNYELTVTVARFK